MTERTKRIRDLNDEFRRTGEGGRIVTTAGVRGMRSDRMPSVVAMVRGFRDFNADNDPNGEHDFGAFGLFGVRFFWKIDYYDSEMKFGSEDPSDPSKTTRVLTIMLAEEY
jgi:hypothetical protein